MKSKISLILCFCLLGFIIYNSSQNYVVSNARSYTYVNDLIKVFSETKLETTLLKHVSYIDLNLIIRKCAHGFEYFMYSFAVIYTINNLTNIEIKYFDVVIYSLFIVLLTAVFDEFFQLFISERTSSVKDVLIDFTGGIIAQFIYYGLYKKKL